MPKSCAILLGALLAAALLSGCRAFESCRSKPKEEPKEEPGPISKTQPQKEGPSSVIKKGDESLPGGVMVTTEGKNVWPPKGPGCDKLVACCEAAGKLGGTVGLSCQLSVAIQPVDCKKALDSVVATIKELGAAPPAECNP